MVNLFNTICRIKNYTITGLPQGRDNIKTGKTQMLQYKYEYETLHILKIQGWQFPGKY